MNERAAEIIEKAKLTKGNFENVKVTYQPKSVSGTRCKEEHGDTTVLVTFDKSAKINKVKLLYPSRCVRVDTNAMRASKRIKFEPAKVAGEPITVKKKFIHSKSGSKLKVMLWLFSLVTGFS